MYDVKDFSEACLRPAYSFWTLQNRNQFKKSEEEKKHICLGGFLK